MKLVGVFNPWGGCNPSENPTAQTTYFSSQEVVYQDSDGTHYVKHLDEGDLPLLLSVIERVKDTKQREEELAKYLNEGVNEDTNLRYKPIKNEFFYTPMPFAAEPDLRKCYASFKDFPGNVILEKEDESDLDHYNRAVVLFPQKKLIVGSHEFVYQKCLPSIQIEGKSAEEIKGIINWLVQNMYLEEAYELINRIKSSRTSLEEYRHPDHLFVTDGSTNFLDSSLYQIEDLYFVRARTKNLNLKIFSK